jgi:hypothetical protein
VNDSQTAVAIAKKICDSQVNHSLQWRADLNDSGHMWIVDTMPSLKARATKHLWVVNIPVNGPYPTTCWDSMYELFDVLPLKHAP